MSSRREVRASDAERDAVVAKLERSAATGRLDFAELEQRVGLALAAKYRTDLAAVLADLPEPDGAAQFRGRVDALIAESARAGLSRAELIALLMARS